MKLNLGCGQQVLDGYVNVDLWPGDNERILALDLESFPWPWPDSSISEVHLVHALEHLGESTKVYLKIWQEIYRVLEPAGLVYIAVPHPLSDDFLGDPTHVRAITPQQMTLFSRKICEDIQAKKWANTPLALMLDIDFTLVDVEYKLAARLSGEDYTKEQLAELMLREFNVVQEIHMILRKEK